MIDHDAVERAASRFAPPPDSFERLARRHTRKERRQRVAAGVVGVSILVTGLLLGRSAFRSLNPAIDDPVPLVPVQEETAFLLDLDGGRLTPLAEPLQGLEPSQVLPSPDRSMFALGSSVGVTDTQLFVAERDGTGMRVLTEEPTGVVLGGWSPDGRRLVYVTDRLHGPLRRQSLVGLGATIRVVDVSTGEITDVFSTKGYITMPTFAPDGERILFTLATGTMERGWLTGLWTVPATGGRPTRLIEKGAYGSFSPDGTRIAYRPTIRISGGCAGSPCWGVAAGNAIVASDGSEVPGRKYGTHVSLPNVFLDVRPLWSPDGSRLLAAGPSNGVSRFEVRELGSGERVEVGYADTAEWFDDHTLVVTDPGAPPDR